MSEDRAQRDRAKDATTGDTILKRGREMGKEGARANKLYVWAACPVCDWGRYISAYSGIKTAEQLVHQRCGPCARKEMKKATFRQRNGSG